MEERRKSREFVLPPGLTEVELLNQMLTETKNALEKGEKTFEEVTIPSF